MKPQKKKMVPNGGEQEKSPYEEADEFKLAKRQLRALWILRVIVSHDRLHAVQTICKRNKENGLLINKTCAKEQTL